MPGVKPREPRFNSLSRGFFIGAFIAIYGFFTRYPQASFTWMFLVGAALQLSLIFVRKFLPPELHGQALEVTEMIEGVVWVPTNSTGSTVHETLRASSGSMVDVGPAQYTLVPAGAATAPAATEGGRA